MGHSRKRVGTDGRRCYTAYYDDHRGRRRSVGTSADIAWQSAEATQHAGQPNSTNRGKVSFERYVDDRWFPNHVLEPSTRESYHYCLQRHILPWFGLRMRDILPTHVREWVTDLGASSVSLAQIRHVKIILSAVFTTALNDFVVGTPVVAGSSVCALGAITGGVLRPQCCSNKRMCERE